MSNVIMVVMWLVVQFSDQIENENKILYIKLHTHYVVYKSYMSRDHDDVMDVTCHSNISDKACSQYPK